MPITTYIMVVLCDSDFYQTDASVLPYSETNGRTSRANEDCRKVPVWQVRESDRARPNGHPVRRENLR